MMKNILFILVFFSISIVCKSQKVKFKRIDKSQNISDVKFGKANDLYVLSHNGQVNKLNIDTIASLWSFNGKASAMGISSSGDFIAIGTPDGSLHIFNNQQPVKDFKAHRKAIIHTAFSVSGKYLATTGLDSTIKIWSAGTYDLLQEIHTKSDWVTDLKFSLDDEFLVYSTSKGKILLWNLKTGNLSATHQVSKRWIRSIAICPDSMKYAVCGDDQKITILSFKDKDDYQLKKSHRNIISNIQFISKDYLVSISHDNRIAMNNIHLPVEKAVLKHFKGYARYKCYFYDLPGDKYFSSLSVSAEKKTVAIATYGKGIALLNDFHQMIENPHQVIIHEVDNVRMDSVGVDPEFHSKNNACILKGSISRPVEIRNAWLYLVKEDMKVKLKVDKNGDFKLQAGIYEGLTDYAIIIEDWDKNLKPVRYNFSLKKID